MYPLYKKQQKKQKKQKKPCFDQVKHYDEFVLGSQNKRA